MFSPVEPRGLQSVPLKVLGTSDSFLGLLTKDTKFHKLALNLRIEWLSFLCDGEDTTHIEAHLPFVSSMVYLALNIKYIYLSTCLFVID